MQSSEKNFIQIIFLALAITMAIFALGVLINHGLDFVRINTIVDQMTLNDVGTLAFSVQDDFTKSFDLNSCKTLNQRVISLKIQIRQVGGDLGSYSSLSLFKKKDFDYLKRKYILLQLRFFTLIKQLNEECDNPYISILFFYEIDQDDSERQGFILEEISKEYDDKVIVLTIDKDYEDESLVEVLTTRYNITEAPVIIINDERKEGLTYGGPLNASILKIIRRPDPYASVDFNYVIDKAGINKTEYLESIEKLIQNTSDPFAKGDLLLISGRLQDNASIICSSFEEFDTSTTENVEEKALLAETSGAVSCGRNRKAFLQKAAEHWRTLGVEWRAQLVEDIAELKKPALVFEPASIEPALIVPDNAKKDYYWGIKS